MNDTAVVIFSGGQDSTTCLALAKACHEKVYAITFAYGQKHKIELQQAEKICKRMDIEQIVIDTSFLGGIVNSALTSNGNVNAQHPDNEALPASFVPNRNALFITLAHAYAQKVGAPVIYTGVCETDYSGYPDCRSGFIQGLTDTLNQGSGTSLTTATPLMHLNKAETFELAKRFGALDVVIELSHTCYNGNRETKHDWGYGCGECPACELRAKGYEEFTKL